MKKIIFYIRYFFAILLGAMFLFSCSKSAFLDAKPQSNLVVPTTITDFQALLENDGGGATGGVFAVSPGIGETSSDNYYMPESYYLSLASQIEKNVYIWSPDIFAGSGNQGDWNRPYVQILNTNIVIEGLKTIDITASNTQSFNSTLGDALFKRAFAFWNLAQVFSPPYDSSSSQSDLGLPLKLSSDITQNVQRSSVQETYDQILLDLKQAINLVPQSFTGHLNRASKPSVYGLLARVYQSMRAYEKAGLYADSSLQLYSGLIDYNTVSTTSIQPFTNKNAETIYQCMATPNGISRFSASSSGASPDSNLVQSYAANDLRGQIFFRVGTGNVLTFKYGYEGLLANYQFTGLTSSEMFLIRAESNARSGKTTESLGDLNKLLNMRWKKNGAISTFVPYTALNASISLTQIITERRKELVFRGLRWMDLRRLNKEGYGITLKRVIAGQIYTLAPNSPLYTLPIPPDEIALSGIKQNIR